MDLKFSARQRMLGLPECERLCGKSSREVTDLASRSGWHGMPEDRLNVTIGVAINMMILSRVKDNGVELSAAIPWLPGLRNEALLKLGEDIANWQIDDPNEVDGQFWPLLYGSADDIRPQVARLLNCCLKTTTCELRYYSQADVERLASSQLETRREGHLPRFTLNAHELLRKLKATCNGPVFIVSRSSAY